MLSLANLNKLWKPWVLERVRSQSIPSWEFFSGSRVASRFGGANVYLFCLERDFGSSIFGVAARIFVEKRVLKWHAYRFFPESSFAWQPYSAAPISGSFLVSLPDGTLKLPRLFDDGTADAVGPILSFAAGELSELQLKALVFRNLDRHLEVIRECIVPYLENLASSNSVEFFHEKMVEHCFFWQKEHSEQQQQQQQTHTRTRIHTTDKDRR